LNAPESATRSSEVAPTPTCRQLAWGFLRIGISGFGGVLPYARHTIVETERWITDREFTDYLSQGQLLPGPNIVNIAVMLGTRFRGWRGAAAAFAGLMVPPFLLFLGIAALYTQIDEIAWVKRAFVGVAAVAAGLILGMGLKLMRSMPRHAWAYAIALAAFVGVFVLHYPLPLVVIALAPIGIFCASRGSKA
jgi:chromate transporter